MPINMWPLKTITRGHGGSEPLLSAEGSGSVIYCILGLRANGSMVLRLSNGCTQDWSWIGL